MTSLAEAIKFGRGIERPFHCHVHEDRNASASVNVVKGVWYCYVCQAKGSADGKKTPSMSDLWTMLEPENSVRVYPEEWLTLFENPIYWQSRFPSWLCWYAKLGEDPLTGDATFPVYTPKRKLAGVGRRLAKVPMTKDGKLGSRYLYPSHWSASRVLHGYGESPKGPVIALVEGAADTHAIWEVGAPAYGCYGAGLHLPQLEQLLLNRVELVLLAFDADDAGDRAARLTYDILTPKGIPSKRVHWPAKDPADCNTDQRREALGNVVPAKYAQAWSENTRQMQRNYQRHLKDR